MASMQRPSRPSLRAACAAACCLLVAAPGAPALADTLTVPGDAATITGAIALAADGDTILVAPGTYVEVLDLPPKRLVIEGTGGAALTIVDASGASSVVTARTIAPPGTTLRGLTLTGGIGQPMSAGSSTFKGGGVFVDGDATLQLVDCVIADNLVGGLADFSQGGALAVFGFASSVSLVGCTLSGNAAATGAALYTSGSHVSMLDCVVSGNTAGSATKAVVYAWSNTGSIVDCTILGNAGTGLFRTGYGTTVTGCTFQDNTGWGCIVYGDAGSVVEDCRFLGNGLGGAYLPSPLFSFSPHVVRRSVFADGATLRLEADPSAGTLIENCTFDGAVIDAVSGSPVSVRNGILRNLVTPIVGGGTVDITYSDVEGGWPGVGNIDADPLWADAAAGDHALLPGSPCINTGDPSDPLDADMSPADMGAVPYEPWADLGGGVAGTAGLPLLLANGPLIAGQGVWVELTGAAPQSATTLVAGATPLGSPFKGGILWPAADVLFPGLLTDGTGSLDLSTTWPPGVPSGVSLWIQVWFADAGGPAGFAGSNGVRGTSP